MVRSPVSFLPALNLALIVKRYLGGGVRVPTQPSGAVTAYPADEVGGGESDDMFTARSALELGLSILEYRQR